MAGGQALLTMKAKLSHEMLYSPFPFHLLQLRMEEEGEKQELNSALHLLGIVLSQLWQEMVKMSFGFNINLLHSSTGLSWHTLYNLEFIIWHGKS